MSVRVVFECGGCDAVADGTGFIRKRFKQLSTVHGVWLPFDIDGVTPEGWVASDPYTGCCYCPTCWEWITTDRVAEEEQKHQEGAR